MAASLAEKDVVLVGAGALCAPAALVMAGAGVGRMLLVDPDLVESVDLAWQPILREEDVGKPMAAALAERLARLFPALSIRGLATAFDAATAASWVPSSHLVVIGGGASTAAFTASDAAVGAGRTYVYGAALGTTAQLLTVEPGATACLRCLFEEPPPPGAIPRRAEAGMLGLLGGFIGALLGAEAVRVLGGERGRYTGAVMSYEARTARSRVVPLSRREECPACGARVHPAEAAA